MSEKLPIVDFLKPKLKMIIHEGVESGFTYSQIIAVLIDLLDDTDLEESE